MSRTELTGLIFLGVIVVGITTAALLLKGCGDDYGASGPGAGYELRVVDSASAPASTIAADEEEDFDSEGKRSKKRKKKGGKRKSAKRTSSKAAKPEVQPRDPFSDTIEMYEEP